jgi:bifunctional non-homologous end joining protein LigD
MIGRGTCPPIVAVALKLRERHFVIDGETVVLDGDGVSDFAAIHSRRHDKRAQLYAFDMLVGVGRTTTGAHKGLPSNAALAVQGQPRPTALAPSRRHLHCRVRGRREEGEIGHILFRVAWNMDIEGIVSKHSDPAYGVGKCKYWVK